MRKASSPKQHMAEDKWSRIPNVTLKSGVMQEFFTRTCRLVDQNKAAVLAVPNVDRLELRSLFLKTVERQGQTRHIRIMNGSSLPTPRDLEDDDGTSLLILNGEDLPEGLQWAIAENRLNFPVTILAVKSDNDQGTRRRWSNIFRDVCGPETLAWPAWRERQEDHAGVLDEILRQIRLPSGAVCPSLDAAARDMLLSAELDGANHLEWTVNQAVRRYLASRDTSGCLGTKHFATPRQMRLLSSHRRIPALSIVK